MKPTVEDLVIADNIRGLIAKKERSKKHPKYAYEVARDAGFDRQTLWRYMNAKTRPTEEQLIKLSQSLGCQPWRFLVGVERPHDRFPNIDIPLLRKKPLYSRIEGPMRSDKELARFFGGMSKETFEWLKPNMEKIIAYVQHERRKDIEGGRFTKKRPIY